MHTTSPHEPVRFEVAAVERSVTDLLTALGLPPDDARAMTLSLLDADLSGVTTHGLRLLPGYLNRLLARAINPSPTVTIQPVGPSLFRVDGDDGFGQVVAHRALGEALDIASETGLAMAFVRGSNHLGALGYLARQGAEHGMFAFVGQNTRDIVAWPGGTSPTLGNNPFALAFPSGRRDPVVLDISCGKISRNRIYGAAARGEELPPGSVLDADGRPTTDPRAAMEGALVAFGGHKGAGLALAVGALAGVIAGAGFGAEVPAPTDFTTQRNIGHVLLFIDLARLLDPDELSGRMDRYLTGVTGAQPDARYPGERSGAARWDADRTGVPVPPHIVTKLRDIAERAGTTLEWPTEVGT